MLAIAICKRILLTFFLCLFLVAVPIAAQSISGSIAGTVVDPTSRAIAGAVVTLASDATRETRSVTTNELGSFGFFSVLPGTYTISIAHPGFQTFQRTSRTYRSSHDG
jgi:hypothetical protein